MLRCAYAQDPVGQGANLPAIIFFTMDFCLCGAILNLKAFCFGAIPDIMMLTVMTALSVLFLSSLTISSCDLCKTVLGGLGLWVIYNSFGFVVDTVCMSDLILCNILTIPKFPEHVCLTACVGLRGLPLSGPK